MNTSYEQGTSIEGAGAYREGKIARAIERRTAKLPSDVFLWAAGAALAGSMAFQVVGFIANRAMKRRVGLGGMLGAGSTMHAPLASFVGQWVPTFLLFGLYDKIVKVAGSDRFARSP